MPLGRLSLELAGGSEHMLGPGERDSLASPLLRFLDRSLRPGSFRPPPAGRRRSCLDFPLGGRGPCQTGPRRPRRSRRVWHLPRARSGPPQALYRRCQLPGSSPRSGRVRGRLETLYRVRGEDLLEAVGYPSVLELSLGHLLGRVGEGGETKIRTTQVIQALRHLRVGRKLSHPAQDLLAILLGELHVETLGGHLQGSGPDWAELPNRRP